MPSKKNRGKAKVVEEPVKETVAMSSEIVEAEPEVLNLKKEEIVDVAKQVEEYLGKRYEIHLTDGRKIRGVLTCTDKDANMILYKADERWPDGDDFRWIGQTLIAKRHVTKMFLVKPPQETRI